jgi:cyanophycinase-like exopeptidase
MNLRGSSEKHAMRQTISKAVGIWQRGGDHLHVASLLPAVMLCRISLAAALAENSQGVN